MKPVAISMDTLFSCDFWAWAWAEVHRGSFLQTSQTTHPERWRRFYEDAGPLLRVVSGLSESHGQNIVTSMVREGLIAPGRSVVDLGCGTGWLSLPLARMGVSVLAVDQCATMIRSVRDAANQQRLADVKTQESCWTALQPSQPFDLVLAAFFPEALSPEGFRRMESLGRCGVILLGDGIKTLPWTEQLWIELIGTPPSGGARQAQSAFNWLYATGRRPNLRHLTLDFKVDLSLQALLSFYRRYFAIFGCEGDALESVLHRVLTPFAPIGHVSAIGQTHLSMTWWTSPEDVFFK